MAIDPIQGLIDYVQEVKPYHTKILEVAVAYAQNETVGVGGEGTTLESEVAIDENVVFSITLFFPGEALTSGSPGIPTRDCGEGWGSEWDRPTPYIVVNANISPQTISLDGSYADDFAVGQCIEVREPYEDPEDWQGSPIAQNTPRFAQMLVTSVAYDSDTNTTILGVTVKLEDYLGSPIQFIGSPIPVVTGPEEFFPLLEEQITSSNHGNADMGTRIISGQEYADRTGLMGSPVTADVVIIPAPQNSFDNTEFFVYPRWTNSSGSPAIPDQSRYVTTNNGKHYMEFEILDLDLPSNSGWGPYVGFTRADYKRRDARYTAEPNQTIWYDGFNTGSNGRIQRGDGTYDTDVSIPRMAQGGVVMMAVDYPNQKVWFGYNGTWVGAGTQDPSGVGSPVGGYWPSDFTTMRASGADPRPYFAPALWLFNQTGGGTGSPFLRTDLQDKLTIRLSSKYWDYTPPTGFGEWPTLSSEANVAQSRDFKWYYRNFNDPGGDDTQNFKAWVNTFTDRAIATGTYPPATTSAQRAYYGLRHDANDNGKFYMEMYLRGSNSTMTFGMADLDSSIFSNYGSPFLPDGTQATGNGSPFRKDSTATVELRSNGLMYDQTNNAVSNGTGQQGALGVFTTGNPSRDGRGGNQASGGDTLMFAVDLGLNRMWAGINGTWSFDIEPGSTGSPLGGVQLYNVGAGSPLIFQTKSWIAFMEGPGSGTSSGSQTVNLGGMEFEYAPPAGFLPWATIPTASNGSPNVPPSGSPPFSGNEFWFPPYPPGAFSNGDVYQIYDVVETKVLKILRRPSPFYGSPGVAPTGSPYTPIWPSFFGSPVGSPFNQGSPITVPGSPLQYPNFGSPNVVDNTIVIKSVTPELFTYGKEFEVRNATETTLNKTYNVYSATDLGGSPNLVELTVLDTVLANTTNDGELVFTETGWSGGDYCDDVPDQWLQNHILEQVEFDWRFSGSASTLENIVIVNGDTGVHSDRIYTSTDGISWTSQTPATTARHVDVAYSTSLQRFVAIHQNRDTSYSDDGGVTWTLETNAFPAGIEDDWETITYVEEWDLFIAGNASENVGEDKLAYSSDGISWTTVDTQSWGNPGANGYTSKVQYVTTLGVGVILMYGPANNSPNAAGLAWSTDGITWTQVQDFVSGGGFFVLGNAKQALVYSETLDQLIAVAGTGSNFVDVRAYAYDTSAAGSPLFASGWSAVNTEPPWGENGKYEGGVWVEDFGQYIFVGEGTIASAGSPDSDKFNVITSPDGTTWTGHTLGRNKTDIGGTARVTLEAVAYSQSLGRAIMTRSSLNAGGSPSLVRTYYTDDGRNFIESDPIPTTVNGLDHSGIAIGEFSSSGLLRPAFQEFIVDADATSNTVTVNGDARYITSEFGSPIGGSPTVVLATIQHSVTGFGSPYDTTLNTNNINVVISNVTYDFEANQSTLQLDTVSESTPSGWIISR